MALRCLPLRPILQCRWSPADPADAVTVTVPAADGTDVIRGRRGRPVPDAVSESDGVQHLSSPDNLPPVLPPISRSAAPAPT